MRTINCEIHGQHSGINRIGQCEKCCEIEWKEYQDSETRKILLQRQELANVPPKYRKSSLESYTPTNSKAKDVLDFCNAYDFRDNIVFLGKTGTGKTHFACSLINKAPSGMQCFYTKYYNLADLKIHERAEFKKLLSYDFLVIDEYGQQANDFKSNLLFEVMDQRQDQELLTILISNLGVVNGVDTFRASISDQLYSRIKENYSIKVCDWEDYRLGKK